MKNTLLKGLRVLTIVGLFVFVMVPLSKVGAYTPVAGSIVATPDTITAGQSTQLKWNSFNATHISISPTVGSVDPSGSVSVSPTQTTTYTMTITNDDGGSGSGTATVYVSPDNQTDVCPNISGNQATVPSGKHINSAGDCVDNTVSGNPPTVSITADDTRISDGDSTRVRWDSDNADECSSSGGSNGWAKSNRALSGTFNTGSLSSNKTYRITCTNAYGSANDSVTVRVDTNNDRVCTDRTATNYQDTYPCRYNNNYTLPTVTLYANQTNLAYNGSTTLNWTTTNATSCYASGGSVGWAGVKSIGPASFYTGSLTSGYGYTLTCTNSHGSASDYVFVNVRGRTITTTTTTQSTGTSYVIINSSVDRNQPIVPTLDNTKPHPGDEINYTITYQNVGNASITGLNLHVTLPFEVDYLTSNPGNPQIAGNNLTFSLGTLRANGQGTVTIRVRVRQDAPPGALLNFPAVLTYIDPSGHAQSVSANVEAQVWTEPANINFNQNIAPDQSQTIP
jgi:uncharacterized repeat protein (TIGR01451 family)